MGRKLAKTVLLRDDSGNPVRLLAGTEPEEQYAEQITNPAAWAPETGEDRNDGGAWPPDGGFDVMDDEEIFAAANSTSLITGEGDDTVQTAKATGSFDSNKTYQNSSVPQLRTMAVERDLDVTGLTRKQEFIDLLVEDDADNE